MKKVWFSMSFIMHKGLSFCRFLKFNRLYIANSNTHIDMDSHLIKEADVSS